MVLNLLNTAELEVPKEVKISVKARNVSVTGPLGTLKRDFHHATLQLRLLVRPSCFFFSLSLFLSFLSFFSFSLSLSLSSLFLFFLFSLFLFSLLSFLWQVSKSGKRRVRAELWSGSRKEVAVVRSVISEIENLITGVIKGFKFELKFVYAHFPINCNITADKKQIEASQSKVKKNVISHHFLCQIRNFIGSRNSLVVRMLHGCSVARSEEKDTIEVSGIDLEKVSGFLFLFVLVSCC